jgi:hypothetical protein
MLRPNTEEAPIALGLASIGFCYFLDLLFLAAAAFMPA